MKIKLTLIFHIPHEHFLLLTTPRKSPQISKFFQFLPSVLTINSTHLEFKCLNSNILHETFLSSLESLDLTISSIIYNNFDLSHDFQSLQSIVIDFTYYSIYLPLCYRHTNLTTFSISSNNAIFWPIVKFFRFNCLPRTHHSNNRHISTQTSNILY